MTIRLPQEIHISLGLGVYANIVGAVINFLYKTQLICIFLILKVNELIKRSVIRGVLNHTWILYQLCTVEGGITQFIHLKHVDSLLRIVYGIYMCI